LPAISSFVGAPSMVIWASPPKGWVACDQVVDDPDRLRVKARVVVRAEPQRDSLTDVGDDPVVAHRQCDDRVAGRVRLDVDPVAGIGERAEPTAGAAERVTGNLHIYRGGNRDSVSLRVKERGAGDADSPCDRLGVAVKEHDLRGRLARRLPEFRRRALWDRVGELAPSDSSCDACGFVAVLPGPLMVYPWGWRRQPGSVANP
jgi:hypothetical protein